MEEIKECQCELHWMVNDTSECVCNECGEEL